MGGFGRRAFAWVGAAAGLLPCFAIAVATGMFAGGEDGWSFVLFFLVIGAVVGWFSGLAFGAVLQLMAANYSLTSKRQRGSA